MEGPSGSLGGTGPVNLDLTPGPRTVRPCDSGFKPLGLQSFTAGRTQPRPPGTWSRQSEGTARGWRSHAA